MLELVLKIAILYFVLTSVWFWILAIGGLLGLLCVVLPEARTVLVCAILMVIIIAVGGL